MEGTCIYPFPRTELDKPVELQVGEKTFRIEADENNLSADELNVRQADLPVGAPVHIRIPSEHPFEAEGRILSSSKVTEIRFNSMTQKNRKALMDLIEDLTRRGLPAA